MTDLDALHFRPAHLAGALLGTVLALAWAVTPAHADTLKIINLAIQQGRFHPETVQVPAGVKFKLRVTNHGPAVEEFESTDLNRERIVAPGRSIEVYLGPLKPGRYKFFGDFHPDTAKGEIVAGQEKP